MTTTRREYIKKSAAATAGIAIGGRNSALLVQLGTSSNTLNDHLK